MSIGKRVSEAFEKMAAGDPESALFQICAAIEETAKREGLPKGKKSYKSWLEDSIPLITAVGIGPALVGLRIRGYAHPELPAHSADGAHGIQDIIYHVVRCGLYHSASLPSDMHITEDKIGVNDNGELQIPKTLVLGLIVAVVASPANSGETTDPNHFFSTWGRQFHINQFWGKRGDLLKELMQLYQAHTDTTRTANTAGG